MDVGETSKGRFRVAEWQVIWVIWLTYGSFYFCRTNIAAAVPGLREDLGLTPTEVGVILGSLKLSYGFGQLVNGQLSEKFSARWLLAIGMIGSAALNILFGLSTGFYFLLFVWASNGYSQALGWTPCMRVTANWFPASRRGVAIGIIGTGYQVAGCVAYLLSGWAAERYGWRGALYVPAGLLVAASLHMLFFLNERPGPPERPSTSTLESDSTGREKVRPHGSVVTNVAVTLVNPALWLLAISLGLLNACRYGFLDWGIDHLYEVQGEGVGKAAIKYALLPLGGIAGSLVAGWATDRFFDGRRAPVICLLLLALGGLTIFYNSAVHMGTTATCCTLVLVGFTIYGPQVLLVGTAPVDLARRGTPAAAVGFVNFMGYMGAFGGDSVTGRVRESYGWEVAVSFWAACAFVAAGTVALLWNTTATSDE